jgi:hypothetical protein
LEAEGAAVVAGTTVGAWGEFAVVGVNASDTITGPSSVASTLVGSWGVGAESVLVAQVLDGVVVPGVRVAALVLILVTVETRPTVGTATGVAVDRDEGGPTRLAVNNLFLAALETLEAGGAIFARARGTVIDIVATRGSVGTPLLVYTIVIKRLPVLVAVADEGAVDVTARGLDVTVVNLLGTLVDVLLAVVTNPVLLPGETGGALALVPVRNTLKVDAGSTVVAWATEAVVDILATLDVVIVVVWSRDPCRGVVVQHTGDSVTITFPPSVALASVPPELVLTRGVLGAHSELTFTRTILVETLINVILAILTGETEVAMAGVSIEAIDAEPSVLAR